MPDLLSSNLLLGWRWVWCLTTVWPQYDFHKQGGGPWHCQHGPEYLNIKRDTEQHTSMLQAWQRDHAGRHGLLSVHP